MEKRNILKLMALIVLMTVVFCGAAFAAETTYVECGHTLADLGANPTRVEAACVEATCQTPGKTAYLCTMTGHASGDTNRVVMVEGTVDLTNHVGDKPLVSGQYTEYELNEKPTCTASSVVATYCDVCGAKATLPEGATAATGTSKSGWHLANDGNYYWLTIKEGDAKISTSHPGTKLVDGYIQWANGVVPQTGYVWEATAAATCNTYGYKQYKCEACGQSFKVYDDIKTVPVHKLVEKESPETSYKPTYDEATGTFTYIENAKEIDKKDATCLNGASTVYQCKECDKKFTKYVGATLDHNYVNVVVTKEATCNADGFTKTVSACSMCDGLNPVQPNTPVTIIPKKDHNTDMYAKFGWEKEPLTDNKGVEIFGNGHKATVKTTGEYKVDDKTIVPYTITYTYNKPVCGEKDGSANYTCSLCGLNKTVVIKKEDHQWVYGDVKRPNGATYCTVAGVQDAKCSACNAVKQVEVAAEKEHKLVKTYTQVLDKAIEARYVNEKGKLVTGLTKNPVFLEAEFNNLIPCVEYKIIYTCENGKCPYEMTERVEAKKADDHFFPETADLTVNATCKDAGYYLYNCEFCSETKTVNIDKIAHTWGAAETTPATCDKPGTITKTCKVCSEVDTQEIPVLGHVKKDASKAPTCTTTGYKKTICEVCGEQLEYTALPIKHTPKAITTGLNEFGVYEGTTAPSGYTYYKAPTCTTPGARSYFCDLCNAEVVNETIDALNHVNPKTSKTAFAEAADKADLEANCTSVGMTVEQCAICKIYRAVELKGTTKKDHVYNENDQYVVLKKATCTEKGMIAYKCINPTYKFSATTGTWTEQETKCAQYVEKPTPADGHKFVYEYDDKTNSMVAKCSVCDLVNSVAKDKAEYTVTVSGKNGTIVLKNEDTAIGLEKVYVRYSVGYEKNGVSYAVVLTVKVEWDNGKEGEVGSFTVPTIQGSGTFTGASYIVTTDANADELGLAAAAANSYGSLIK